MIKLPGVINRSLPLHLAALAVILFCSGWMINASVFAAETELPRFDRTSLEESAKLFKPLDGYFGVPNMVASIIESEKSGTFPPDKARRILAGLLKELHADEMALVEKDVPKFAGSQPEFKKFLETQNEQYKAFSKSADFSEKSNLELAKFIVEKYQAYLAFLQANGILNKMQMEDLRPNERALKILQMTP